MHSDFNMLSGWERVYNQRNLMVIPLLKASWRGGYRTERTPPICPYSPTDSFCAWLWSWLAAGGILVSRVPASPSPGAQAVNERLVWPSLEKAPVHWGVGQTPRPPQPSPAPVLELTALLGQWQASCGGESTLGLVSGRRLVWAAPGSMPSCHNKVRTAPSCFI